MKLRTALVLSAPLVLTIAACGRSNTAATQPEADTVEMPANEALAPVTATPVADPSANAVPTETGTAEPTEQEKIEAAGDSAADTAAAAADAMEETTTTTTTNAETR